MTFKEIIHENDKHQFVMTFESGNSQGLVQYDHDLRTNTIDIYHTEIPVEFRGKGLGEILIEQVQILAKEKQANLVASCTYAHKILMKKRSTK